MDSEQGPLSSKSFRPEPPSRPSSLRSEHPAEETPLGMIRRGVAKDCHKQESLLMDLRGFSRLEQIFPKVPRN